jgi:murein DD-endopeptidase MepM/ murein hydrolase activator NlpD
MNSHNAARKPSYKIEQISFDINPLKTLKLLQDGKGNFDGKITQKPLFRKEYAAHISVDGSLYGSAARAGVKSSVVSEAIRLYSWGVDFERDLKKGDRLDIFFSQEETQNGEMSQNPVVEYASLTVKGKTRSIYRHERLNGQVAYFDEKGQSLRRTLMKTPIDGARVSSGFGMRRHPVLGYSKMHKGIDFSAPRGTPIYAAGDGVIEKAGRNGSYGNYVAIRHNKTFKTAYAHMNGFAKGIRSGTRVSQGQVIGYVGTTGRSTGPHLHYEILKNGQQINPNRVDLPIGEVLEARELRRFRNNVKNYNAKFKKLDVSTTIVADAGKNEPVNQ